MKASSVGEPEITVDGSLITVEEIVDLARGSSRLRLSRAAQSRERIEVGYSALTRLIEHGKEFHGASNSFSDSCKVKSPNHQLEELPLSLIQFHGCGMGCVR